MKKTIILLAAILTCNLLLEPSDCFAQHYTRMDSIPVKMNGSFLKMPWVGGHNYIQLSDIDMNFDGMKDLFVFDRTGHKVTCYINKGTPNTVDYVDSTSKYASKFPHLEDWALIRDYNCDGLPDIFTYATSVGGIKVWKNTSSGGNLQFTLQSTYLKSNYGSFITNLYVTRTDIPSIDDVDDDGDLDVVTMDYSATQLEFHMNKSKEKGYGCDSLIFALDQSGCWGNVREDLNNCNVYLNACRLMNPDTSGHIHPLIAPAREEEYPFPDEPNVFRQGLPAPAPKLHSGNCSVCLDMNGDKAKEILLGQISCCSMILLTNGGTPASANFIAKDTTFPSNNIQASLSLFPCGYFLDLNNDNKRDLVVCPNAPNISIDNESIWYYENTGTDSTPVFKRQTRSLFQQDMIDVGEGADPVFFDFDNDGLSDLLVSNYAMSYDSCSVSYRYGVWAFKNIGTATNPKFNLVTKDYDSLSVKLVDSVYNSTSHTWIIYPIPSKHLTFGDVDGDGDADMFIGDYDGHLHYFRNTAGAGNPANFILTTQNYPDDTSTPIDIGSYATPQLIDVGRDGDLDLIIGERSGNINYYENTGTTTAPVFSFITNTFGGVHTYPLVCCTGYSVPFMYDDAGSYRLIVGSEADRNFPATGWLWYYTNIDGNLGGKFTLVDSLYQNIWEGTRMTVNGKDINNDGRMDLAIGNYAGGVALYMGDTLSTAVSEVMQPSFDFSIYPNPSSGQFAVYSLQFTTGAHYNLEVYTVLGEIVFQKTIDSKQETINLNVRPGVYSCVAGTDKFSKTKKLVLIR
ncbi:MAG: T9SS type A sorting domain-containing protein [Bacteroidetes bacterium]|nr:T9SS type A sorting domain-containing protein [Bacteroidota bacterium]